jgi:hypothetical protein
MKRTLIAVAAVAVAAVGSLVALVALTVHRLTHMRLTQYAWDSAETPPVGAE